MIAPGRLAGPRRGQVVDLDNRARDFIVLKEDRLKILLGSSGKEPAVAVCRQMKTNLEHE
jgi:hypothetical protein